jgi:hypothetical protein
MPTVRTMATIASLAALCACAASQGTLKNPPAIAASQKTAGCLTDTGSRIPTNDLGCSSSGHSYSSADIDRTGASTAGEALRLLDPTLVIH